MRMIALAAIAVLYLTGISTSYAYTDVYDEETEFAEHRGPSFNCRYAKTPDEIWICRSPELSMYDRNMAELYFKQMQPLTAAEQRDLATTKRDYRSMQRQWKAEQARWLKQRRACGYNYDCIFDSYQQRIAALKEEQCWM